MLRYALSPRWIPGHLIALGLMWVCWRMGAWQWDVGMSPTGPAGPPATDLRNLFYAVQWWFFGLVVAWFWWRYLRDERDEDLAWDAEQAALAAAAAATEVSPAPAPAAEDPAAPADGAAPTAG